MSTPFHHFFNDFSNDETGQDLIEYVLIIALIAFAAIVGMNTVASAINQAFGNVGTKLSTNVS